MFLLPTANFSWHEDSEDMLPGKVWHQRRWGASGLCHPTPGAWLPRPSHWPDAGVWRLCVLSPEVGHLLTSPCVRCPPRAGIHHITPEPEPITTLRERQEPARGTSSLTSRGSEGPVWINWGCPYNARLWWWWHWGWRWWWLSPIPDWEHEATGRGRTDAWTWSRQAQPGRAHTTS